MKWFKRTWLSIIRRPGKTLLLFLVVFVMANLLAGSLAIIQTSETIKENLKESITPKISISYEKYYTENKVNYIRNVTLEQLDKYSKINDTFKSNDKVLSTEEHYSLTNIIAKRKDLGWPQSNDEVFNLNIYSTDVIEPLYFIEGKHKLLGLQKNRFFTEEELASDEILIVVDKEVGQVLEDGMFIQTGLNELNNIVKLTVCSSSTYYDESQDKDVPYEYQFDAKVVGVLYNKGTVPFKNVVYMSNPALSRVVKEANAYFESIGVNKVIPDLQSTYLSMDTIDDIQTFDNEYKELIQELPEGFEYESSVDIYKKNVGPVNNLDSIAKIIFITSIVSTIIVLGLVIVFFISDRKKEMGIYSSVGERRRNVILQILCEITLVSTLAIGFASGTGLMLGNKLSDYMLEVQRYVQREQTLGALGKVEALYKPIANGISMRTRDDVIDNYEVKPTAEYFTIILAVGELSVIVSCILPMVYLSSLKPKEIML